MAEILNMWMDFFPNAYKYLAPTVGSILDQTKVVFSPRKVSHSSILSHAD